MINNVLFTCRYQMYCDFCDESYIESCILNCGHMFHSVCIHRWIIYNPTCPLCRLPSTCDREHSIDTTDQLVQIYREISREDISTNDRVTPSTNSTIAPLYIRLFSVDLLAFLLTSGIFLTSSIYSLMKS